MLSQVPKVEAVSDEVFSREFQKLVSLVKSLSRSVQPAHESDIIAFLGTGKLLFGVAKHHWNTRVHKKAYIEAWVWSLLIVTVFDKPFGFCKKAMSLNEDWILMFGKDHKDDWPVPTPESENWRFITSKRLVSQIGHATVTSGQVHKEYSQLEGKAKDLQKSVLETREDIANIIGMNLIALNPKTDLSHIPDIVNQAFTLAVAMAGQLCRIQLTWPEIGQEFEARCMSSVPDRSGQDIDRGVVAFIVHPGLTKWGNENGQKFEGFHEIVPSLVQLEPAVTKHEVSNGHVDIKQEPEKTFRWFSSY